MGRPRKNRSIFLTLDAEFWDSPQFFGLASACHGEIGNGGCLAFLDLVQDLNIPCTFFVSVVFARRHPQTIHRILDEGHEVASHSYTHSRLVGLTRQERLFEIGESKRYIEETFGIVVRGFRAPGNQIAPDHFQLLKECGYRYDSSVHPVLHPYQPFAVFQPKSPFLKEGILEIPIATLGGLPVSWVWMRNAGSWLPRLSVTYNHWLGREPVLYVHSWDFEPLPSVPGVPRYVTRRTGQAFLDIIDRFVKGSQAKGASFGRMDHWTDEYLDHHPRI